MYTSPIVPAIIPTSSADLIKQVQVLSSVSELHLDVVDGIFVATPSWPYNQGAGLSEPEKLSIKPLLAPYTLEVDLMVSKPLLAGSLWIELGADMLVFHLETISLEAFTNFVNETNITVGISAHNQTPYETLKPYLAQADYVQVMGIAEIGSQGQPFDERALTRIKTIRQDFPNLAISIDGSVNEDTLPKLKTYQLNRYIVGSAIIKQPDPMAAYQKISELVR